jgi:hypothetical protein
MDVKALREPTCVSPVIEWVVDCEKYGGCWQAMTYAIVFFATIFLFLTVVGIPLILLAAYEYGQQKLAAQVENQPVPENPLQAEVTALRQDKSSLTSRNTELSDRHTRQEAELVPLRRLQDTFTAAQGDQGKTLAGLQEQLQTVLLEKQRWNDELRAAVQAKESSSSQLQSAQHALSEKDQYLSRIGGALQCPSDEIENTASGLKDANAVFIRRVSELEQENRVSSARISDLDKLANERLQELERLKAANHSLEERVAKIQMPPPPARQPFDANMTPRRPTRSASFDSPRWHHPGKGGGTFPPAPASPRTPARTLNGASNAVA